MSRAYFGLKHDYFNLRTNRSGYSGTDEGYIDLWCGIWKQAMKDERKEAMKQTNSKILSEATMKQIRKNVVEEAFDYPSTKVNYKY